MKEDDPKATPIILDHPATTRQGKHTHDGASPGLTYYSACGNIWRDQVIRHLDDQAV
jgi:hypothetical protein